MAIENIKKILPKNQKEYVLLRAQNYNNIQHNISSDIDNVHRELVREYRETIRNMAILSGAIATFSLLFLSNQNSVNILILLGISLLLINVMLAFTHIIGGLNLDVKKLEECKTNYVRPIQNMSKNCLAYLKSEATYDNWSAKESDFIENTHNLLTQHLDDLINNKPKKSYVDKVMVSIFVLAILLIIYSLLVPSLIPFFYNNSI